MLPLTTDFARIDDRVGSGGGGGVALTTGILGILARTDDRAVDGSAASSTSDLDLDDDDRLVDRGEGTSENGFGLDEDLLDDGGAGSSAKGLAFADDRVDVGFSGLSEKVLDRKLVRVVAGSRGDGSDG
ncbi:MAG: hypothetical protein SGARI_002160 [Bacillariaceae sp.]